jgi:hypothetical protein
MKVFVVAVVSLLFVVLIDVGSFRTSYFNTRKPNLSSIKMVLSGISNKMGSIMQFIAGQTKITESNIEDTLKVYFY